MPPISYARHQFPPVVIQHAVWLYLRFTLSLRDVEDLLAERGLDISYETVRRWVMKFGPGGLQLQSVGGPRSFGRSDLARSRGGQSGSVAKLAARLLSGRTTASRAGTGAW